LTAQPKNSNSLLKPLYSRPKIIGSEDCLYLNVFTPDIPVTENQNKLPVIVGLFGTNFTSETSRDDYYGPDRFMQTGDVVLG
jgi:carboxylesterase type B